MRRGAELPNTAHIQHPFKGNRSEAKVSHLMVLISRSTPACIVFLVDRSDSMGRLVSGGGGETLAMKGARFVNAALAELVQRSTKRVEGPARDYFYVGLYGYGVVPETGREGVAPILSRDNDLEPIFDMQRLVASVPPSGMPAPGKEPDISWPVWIEAAHGYRTPICRAIAEIEGHLLTWSAGHPSSPPPVVVNVTDGLVGKDSFEGADAYGWYTRLASISTDRGVVKVFDAVVSTETDVVVLRPATTKALTDAGWTVVELAMLLPGVEISTWASSAVIIQGGVLDVAEPAAEADAHGGARGP